jgi:hypothetical protein
MPPTPADMAGTRANDMSKNTYKGGCRSNTAAPVSNTDVFRTVEKQSDVSDSLSDVSESISDVSTDSGLMFRIL